MFTIEDQLAVFILQADVDVVGLSDPDCRTAKSLGNSHGFFGFRHYNYNDTECEGNKHILDDDL